MRFKNRRIKTYEFIGGKKQKRGFKRFRSISKTRRELNKMRELWP